MMRFLVALPVLLAVAGCGRVGPIAPAGPPDRVTYPRQYPAPDTPAPRPAETPAPARPR